MKSQQILTQLMIFVVVFWQCPGQAMTTYDINDLLEPDFYVYGLCFSPFMDGQGPGTVIGIEQIRVRLAAITRKTHTHWIRTYGATGGLENIPPEANSIGLKVAMGSWVRVGSDPNEITNLIQACIDGVADIAVVGNEELYAYDSRDNSRLTPTEYYALLDDVRQQLDDANCSQIPVAAAEPFETLFLTDGRGVSDMRYAELLDHIDILFVSIYPFWRGFPEIEDGGAHISTAKDILALKYGWAIDKIAARKPGMMVVIGETGWANNGVTYGDAEPSMGNEARYFHEVSEWAADNNVPLFYFEAFDEKWKASSPTEIEANWGIWSSDGKVKQSFFENPVFWEDFDSNKPGLFCARQHWNAASPEPYVSEGDSGSDGSFLRLLEDATGVTHYSSTAFDRAAAGLFKEIVIQVDFRMSGADPEADADGLGLLLLPTVLHGTTGCSRYSDLNFFAEKPLLERAITFGLDIYHPSEMYDKVHVGWDGQSVTGNGLDSPVNLDSGVFHRLQIHLRSYETKKVLVDIFLHPDVYTQPDAEPVVIAENLLIDVPGHPYTPYDSRLEFVGRCGGLDVSADIDNIFVLYKADNCANLTADLNSDCRVNMHDLAVLAQQWLVNCNNVTQEPLCQ
jgi:exo-beta-1,3-glucanase (GH17 family)